MSGALDYRERAFECLTWAQRTHDPQTKVWAIEFAALLHRLSTKADNQTSVGKELQPH